MNMSVPNKLSVSVSVYPAYRALSLPSEQNMTKKRVSCPSLASTDTDRDGGPSISVTNYTVSHTSNTTTQKIPPEAECAFVLRARQRAMLG